MTTKVNVEPMTEECEIQLGRIPSEHGFAIMILSFVIFRCVTGLLKARWTNGIVADKNRFRWLNVGTSFAHACAVTVWLPVSSLLYPEMFMKPLVHYNYATYGIVAFSAGYFFADMADIVICKQSRACYEVLVHHIAVVVIMIYIIHTCSLVGFTAISLGVEINSVFLHARKLMQMCGVNFGAYRYRVVVMLNLVTFLTFRFTVLIYITYSMMYYRSCLPVAFFISLASGWAVAWFINVVLFQRLVVSDLLRKVLKNSKTKEAEMSENGSGHVNNNHTEQHLRKRENNHL